MTVRVEFDNSTNRILLRKDDVEIAAENCVAAPSDRNLEVSYVGRSRFWNDDYFQGEMRELFVADEVVRNLARRCSLQHQHNQSNEHSACLTLQSTTWTPSVGTQNYRDQMLSSVGGVEGCADLAVDGDVDTCSQSWRETSPWWRVDLEVPRLVVSVRVYGRIDCCQEELEGLRIYVGNWQAWDRNPACAVNITAPTNPRWVDVLCQAEGRFVFIVLPGTNRSLALCEVEVNGLSNDASTAVSGILPNCTSCLPGRIFFQARLHMSGQARSDRISFPACSACGADSLLYGHGRYVQAHDRLSNMHGLWSGKVPDGLGRHERLRGMLDRILPARDRVDLLLCLHMDMGVRAVGCNL